MGCCCWSIVAVVVVVVDNSIEHTSHKFHFFDVLLLDDFFSFLSPDLCLSLSLSLSFLSSLLDDDDEDGGFVVGAGGGVVDDDVDEALFVAGVEGCGLVGTI